MSTVDLEDLLWKIRTEALDICGERIANSERHVVPGKMPAHTRIYFSDDDVRLDDVLAAARSVLSEAGVA